MLFKSPIELIEEARIERHGPKPITTSGWTAERVQKLRLLWDDLTVSARQIADILGGGITRNAVLGKAHRMKLADRPFVKPPRPVGAAKRKRRHVAKEKQVKPAIAPALVLAEPPKPIDAPQFLCIPLNDLEQHHCRFPIGHPGDKGFGFCGLDRPSGAIYCTYHHDIAFVKHSKVKTSRAERETRIREMIRRGALKNWAA